MRSRVWGLGFLGLGFLVWGGGFAGVPARSSLWCIGMHSVL